MKNYLFPELPSTQQALLIEDARDLIPTLAGADISTAPPELAQFLDTVRVVEKDYQARSMIYRESIRSQVGKAVDPKTASQITAWKHAVRGAFFMIEETGKRVSVIDTYGVLHDLGTYNAEMYASLVKKSKFPDHITNTHSDHVTDRLQLNHGTLLLETGAGLDVDRIIRLKANAVAQGSHLVCHDIPPLLAAIGRQRMPDVPYIALPSLKEFLGRALEKFKGRKVVAMKNTITSLNEEEVVALLEAITHAGVERLVVTQSIGPNMDLFVEGTQAHIERMNQSLAMEAAGRRAVGNQYNQHVAAAIIAERSQQIAYTALLEIIFQNLIDNADTYGYSVEISTNSVADATLTEDKALDFLKDKGMPFYEVLTEELFNEITFTPTAITYRLKKDITPKTLRVRSKQVHLTLVKQKSTHSLSAIGITGREELGIAIPSFQALRSVYPGISIGEIAVDPRGKNHFKELTANHGLAAAFELAGKLCGAKIVKQYCDTDFEAKMYKSYGLKG